MPIVSSLAGASIRGYSTGKAAVLSPVTPTSAGSSVSASTSGGFIFEVGTEGFVRSLDNESSWYRTSSTSFGAVANSSDGRYVIALTTPVSTTTTVYRSADYGLTWTASGSFSPASSSFPASVDVNGDGTVMYLAVGSSVYKSTNYGGTWGAVTDPVSSPYKVTQVKCDSTGAKVTVLTDASSSTVSGGYTYYKYNLTYYSSNSGSSWIQVG